MNSLNAPVLQSLGFYDYLVVAFYVLLVVSIGPICRRLNKNPSDYFRGGGNMLWWVGAVSGIAVSISTWTFTGGAAKCYLDGFVMPLIWVVGAVPMLVVLLYVAPRFRRLRVITAMEAVFRRFGMGTEQFYTWFTMPLGIFWGGIGLNTLAVFMSAVFHVDVSATIVVVGALVIFLAVLGGQWAVSFFAIVQGVILLMVTVLVAWFSLQRPEIGGAGNLLNVLPERHLKFDADASFALVWIWIFWNIATGAIGQMDIRNCGKFLRVKDDSSARRMVLMMVLPNIVILMPVIMQIPSMCAAVVFPDMKEIFPNLQSPEEGAWLAMALTVLPQGLLGLMVCAMFGAAADSADAALNANAGFFVRNVYHRYIHPEASDFRQVVVGKLTTLVLGAITIGIGLMVNSLRTLNLFDLFQMLNALLMPPMIVPMVLGLVIKRTPDWSGWSTVLVGLLAGLAAKAVFDASLVQSLLGLSRPLTEREIVDSGYLYVSAATWGVSVIWFVATKLFWRHSQPAHRERIQTLFQDLKRPVDHMAEGGENQDAMQYKVVGILCAVTGAFMLLCVLIPNPLSGRLCFLLIGGVLGGLGLLFIRAWKRAEAKEASVLEKSGT
jgi:SSS family solute:Na+ symporter